VTPTPLAANPRGRTRNTRTNRARSNPHTNPAPQRAARGAPQHRLSGPKLALRKARRERTVPGLSTYPARFVTHAPGSYTG